MGADLNKKFYQEVLFSNDECNSLLDITKNLKEKRSTVYDGKKNIKESRTSTQFDFYLNDFYKEMLLNKLKNLNIKNLPDKIRILKYSEGQQFTKHRDKNSKDFFNRYKTLIVQLSDKKEYKGGELVIYENENTSIEANKEKGNVIIFNSELLHEAKEIIKGNRYVLVSWLSKNDLNLKSTLL